MPQCREYLVLAIAVFEIYVNCVPSIGRAAQPQSAGSDRAQDCQRATLFISIMVYIQGCAPKRNTTRPCGRWEFRLILIAGLQCNARRFAPRSNVA